jgi:hypothetical protein
VPALEPADRITLPIAICQIRAALSACSPEVMQYVML